MNFEKATNERYNEVISDPLRLKAAVDFYNENVKLLEDEGKSEENLKKILQEDLDDMKSGKFDIKDFAEFGCYSCYEMTNGGLNLEPLVDVLSLYQKGYLFRRKLDD